MHFSFVFFLLEKQALTYILNKNITYSFATMEKTKIKIGIDEA